MERGGPPLPRCPALFRPPPIAAVVGAAGAADEVDEVDETVFCAVRRGVFSGVLCAVESRAGTGMEPTAASGTRRATESCTDFRTVFFAV